MNGKSLLLDIAEIKNVIYPSIKEKRETIDIDIQLLLEKKVIELNQNLDLSAAQIKQTLDKELEYTTNGLIQTIASSQEIETLKQIHLEAKTQVQALGIGTIIDFKKGMKLNA